MLGGCIELLQMKVDTCVHHWEIAIADGPVSEGTCKLCKMTKEFQNSFYMEMRHITLERDTNESLEREERNRKAWNAY